MDEVPFKWARDGEGSWHRISGFPDVAGTATTLCGRVVSDPAERSSEPPPEWLERCHDCEIEGESAPPNH